MRIVALLLALFLAAPLASAAASPVQGGELAAGRQIRAADLPAEARQTLELIRRGGPYPHKQDGVVFGNRERLLPLQPRGYYREFTVRTPGARDRGARRLVAGTGSGGDVKTTDEFWYTDDHYASFRRVVEGKAK